MSRVIEGEEEVGPQRYCRRCEEWWPDDDEFWVYAYRPAGQTFVSRGVKYVRLHTTRAVTCRACRRMQQTERIVPPKRRAS